jgi:hypothetical protein
MVEDSPTPASGAAGLTALAARLGRGSPAGMAVALLYNINRGKEVGNFYSSQNKKCLTSPPNVTGFIERPDGWPHTKICPIQNLFQLHRILLYLCD